MSIRLRELIRDVRACKTAADERAVVAKESAEIRTAFKEENSTFRHRNVAKLLFIHMLGYSTHFGQMECLKLIPSPKFSEKRIGYLGLVLLLDERQEVLMLVTNSLQSDLQNPNQYVVGQALTALGTIASADMARALAPDVEKLLRNTNPYIRKKAALAACRIIRKVPELAEEFVDRVCGMLNDRNHGVLLSAITMLVEAIDSKALDVSDHASRESSRSSTDDDGGSRRGGVRRIVPTLVRTLKNLVLSGYSPEHDVSGITDPFLQVKILKLLRLLGTGHAESSEIMNDILAQVATNTETTKNAGNAILYECVQTIMSINSATDLRVLAINILGRFLMNRDNNIRYVALNTLSMVLASDSQAVQRHRNTIVECLKDPDISIRRRALDLIYALVNESNARVLVRELLNYLSTADGEFRQLLTSKLCSVVENFSPSRKFHIDTICRVVAIAGNFVEDSVVNNLLRAISQSPELQGYASRKLYSACMSQPGFTALHGLVQAAAWCAGEYAQKLITGEAMQEDEEPLVVSSEDLLNFLTVALKARDSSTLSKEYIITALMKVAVRLSNQQSVVDRVKALLLKYRSNINLEIQQRSVEYISLFEFRNICSDILAPMPALEKSVQKYGEGNGSTPTGDDTSSLPMSVVTSVKPGIGGLDDLMGDLLGPSTSRSVPTSLGGGGGGSGGGHSTSSTSGIDNLLDDLLGSGPVSSAAKPYSQSSAAASLKDGALADIFGGGGGSSISTGIAVPSVNPMASFMNTPDGGMNGMGGMGGGSSMSVGGMFSPMTVFNEDGLMIVFNFQKQPGNPQLTVIQAVFTNMNLSPLTNLNFQVAVPKFIKLQMNPPTSTTVPAGGVASISQTFKLLNSMHGQKPLAVRMKIEYMNGMLSVSKMADCKDLPSTL